MSTLPLAVRVALWAGAAVRTGLDDSWLAHAQPEADAVAGELAQTLAAWQAAGEQALWVALPRPGGLLGMPPTSPEARAAAVAAGQCVVAPTVGGLLVPHLSGFGPEGDRGTLVTWTAYPADPLPRHVVEATDAAEAGRVLTEAVRTATLALEAAGGLPWRPIAAVAPEGGPGLPRGLSGRALVVLDRAAAVAGLARAGLAAEDEGPALDAVTSGRRRLVLRELLGAAEDALAVAACACALGQARSSTER